MSPYPARLQGAIHIVDEGDDAGDQLFWKALGCDGTQPPSIKDATDDDEHERKVSSQARLYQLSDEDQQGKIVVKQLRKTDAVEMMTRADLHSEDAYVLDTGANGTGIWAWVGRLASKDERKYVDRSDPVSRRLAGRVPRWSVRHSAPSVPAHGSTAPCACEPPY